MLRVKYFSHIKFILNGRKDITYILRRRKAHPSDLRDGVFLRGRVSDGDLSVKLIITWLVDGDVGMMAEEDG